MILPASMESRQGTSRGVVAEIFVERDWRAKEGAEIEVSSKPRTRDSAGSSGTRAGPRRSRARPSAAHRHARA